MHSIYNQMHDILYCVVFLSVSFEPSYIQKGITNTKAQSCLDMLCNKGTSGWNELVYLQASLQRAALICLLPEGREQAYGGKQSMFLPQGCLTAINSCQVLALILTKGLSSTPG